MALQLLDAEDGRIAKALVVLASDPTSSWPKARRLHVHLA